MSFRKTLHWTILSCAFLLTGKAKAIYDADIGRWMSEDPIGEAGGINLYGYVGNRVTVFIDKMGLDRTAWFMGHAWLEVDTYDKQGNKSGSVALHSAPESGLLAGLLPWVGRDPGKPDCTIKDPSAGYPRWFGLTIHSTQKEDEALVNLWLSHQAESNLYDWNLATNCWFYTLDGLGYFGPPANPSVNTWPSVPYYPALGY